jgi:hypothetical protein
MKGTIMLTDDTIASQARRWLEGAQSSATGLNQEREQALNYFLARPMGNEVAGRSQVQSMDVAETIDWIMPSLMRQFSGERGVVQFSPVGDEDEAIARAMGDYCRHVFNIQNPGFFITHCWLQDALLSKNGYLKIWWDEHQEEEREHYSNRTEDEAFLLLTDPEVDLLEHKIWEGDDGQPDRHDLTMLRRRDVKQIRIAPVAPEDVLVAPGWHAISLKDCPFVAHRMRRTASELVREGFDRELVDSLPGDEDYLNEGTSFARHAGEVLRPTASASPDAMRVITVYECYMRLDADDDGIAELQRVLLAGSHGHTLLSHEPIDQIPLISLTPLPMAHRHYGRSIADLVMEIQKIKTTLFRQVLDSLYLSNNPRVVADKHRIHVEDLMSNRIGGIVRGDPSAVSMLTVPFVGRDAMPVLHYLDQVREERTGVSKTMQGLDPSSLKDQSIYGMSSLMQAAMQKVELIARIFAETGFKELFGRVMELVSKYEDPARIEALTGFPFRQHPRAWRQSRDVRITVGLGNSAVDEKLQALDRIASFQEKIVAVQGGALGEQAVLVDAQNLHHTLTAMVDHLGLKQADRYFRNPTERLQELAQERAIRQALNPEVPMGDPAMELAGAELAARDRRATLEAELELLKHREKLALEHARLELEREVQMAKLAADAKEKPTTPSAE